MVGSITHQAVLTKYHTLLMCGIFLCRAWYVIEQTLLKNKDNSKYTVPHTIYVLT